MRRPLFFLVLVFARACLAADLQLPVVTLPMRGEAVRIVATGDTGGDPSKVAAAIARQHAREPIDAIVLLGDNFYPCGVESEADPQWRKIRNHFSPIGVSLFPVLGNHDYGNPKGFGTLVRTCGNPDPAAQLRAASYVSRWNFPARNYRLRTPTVELFMIDTTPLARQWRRPVLGSDSADAILAALRGALTESAARWKIVAGHHTIRASGKHGWKERGGEGHLPSVLPLLLEKNIDVYLCGHDHHMELISYEDTDPSQPLYLISGAGSRPRPVIPKTKTGLPTLFPRDARSFLGFALLEISPDTLSIRFYDADGAVRGSFSFPK